MHKIYYFIPSQFLHFREGGGKTTSHIGMKSLGERERDNKAEIEIKNDESNVFFMRNL